MNTVVTGTRELAEVHYIYSAWSRP